MFMVLIATGGAPKHDVTGTVIYRSIVFLQSRYRGGLPPISHMGTPRNQNLGTEVLTEMVSSMAHFYLDFDVRDS